MNGVLVILERGGGWHRLSWEALAAGQQLASQVGQPRLAAVPGPGLRGARPELGARKLDECILVQHDLCPSYTADGVVEALSQLIRKLEPAYVVFPHTYQVRDFGPKLATRFQQTLIADVVGVRVDGGAPVFVRQLMQGKLNADYVH